MTQPFQEVVLTRTAELERGEEPEYQPFNASCLASMDCTSSSSVANAIRSIEARAWATAEACLVRDLARLLGGDLHFIEQCAMIPVSENPDELQTKAQAFAFIACIVRGNFESDALDAANDSMLIN